MQFINPIELLDIEDYDPNIIKKAKKRKLAEIELSDDGFLLFENKKIHRNECIKLIDELDDPRRCVYYDFLKKEILLSCFLKNGDFRFFEQNEIAKEYLKTDFLRFISPYLTEKHDTILYEAVKTDDIYRIKLLSRYSIPILENSEANIKTTKLLNNILEDLKKINNEIKEEYHNKNEVSKSIKKTINLVKYKTINVLSNYYSKIRNEIANHLINIAIELWNKSFDAKPSLYLLEYTKKIKTNGIINSRIKKEYGEVFALYKEQQEKEKYSHIVKKYAEKVKELQNLLNNIEKNKYDFDIIKKVLHHSISTQELNQLPEYFREIRDIIAITLRNLSVAVWNSYSEVDYAIILIKTAKDITTSNEIEINLDDSLNKLQKIKQEIADHKNKNEGCYIATACYGSYDHPKVIVFRNFRDSFLSKYILGRYFIKFYYRTSPVLARIAKRNSVLNIVIKSIILNPLHKLLKKRF